MIAVVVPVVVVVVIAVVILIICFRRRKDNDVNKSRILPEETKQFETTHRDLL